MSITVPLNAVPEPNEWETVYGRVILTAGRCSGGVIASQVEFDDDDFRFGPNEVERMTLDILDAWQRRQESA